jgi:Flp pilus assembly protein TadG
MTATRRDDRGTAATELVLVAPALVVLVLFVVFLGRAGQAAVRVQHAADVAARAASMVRHSSMAEEARTTALDELHRNGPACADPAVTVALMDRDVDTVTVTVRCRVSLQALGPLGVGARTVSASSTEVVDLYRAGEEP